MSHTIRVVYESAHVIHWLVDGKYTVRTSDKACGHYACLGCLRVDCEHARAASEWDKGRGAQ